MTVQTCAAPGCDNPVPRPPGRVGRPPIYCTPACRPSRPSNPLDVEIAHADTDTDQPGRDWTVKIRRGQRAVTIATGLGRFTATALAHQLAELLGATTHTHQPID